MPSQPVGPRPVLPLRASDWTPTQLKCRNIGLRMGIFGTVGMVLPFLGLQFKLLNLLGVYADVGALLLFLTGWSMFAGAYLVRTQWCGGRYAAWKVGGVLTGGIVVVLVFLFGAVILGVLATYGLHPKNAVATADKVPTPNSVVPPARRPISQPPAVARPVSHSTDGAKSAVDALTQVQTMLVPSGEAPTASPPPGFPPPLPSELGIGTPPNKLTIIVSGLDKAPGSHDERMKVLLTHLGELAPQGPDWGCEESGSADDRFVRAVVHPVDDVEAAVRAIDLGTATVDPKSPRVVHLTVDPAKFPPP